MIPKAKIVERIISCVVECPFCKEEMMYDYTDVFIVDRADVTCPICGKVCSVQTSDYLSQLN